MTTLALNVLSWTVKVPPWLKTPPPWAALPGEPSARFSATTTSVSLRLPPAFRMPPPLSARPWVIVRPAMVLARLFSKTTYEWADCTVDELHA
jgi:hypothetical protein